MKAPANIRLIVSDLDGTLLDHEQKITPRAKAAVVALKKRGLLFSVGTSRPRPGVFAFARALEVEQPSFVFNGGAFLDAQQNLLSQMAFSAAVVEQTVTLVEAHGVPVWALAQEDWYVKEMKGAHIDRGTRVFGKPPRAWSELDLHRTMINKLVGVSDDAPKMTAAENDMRKSLGHSLTASRSQSYYLDITPAGADKGHGVLTLSALTGIALKEICVLGDMPVDVPMFELAGYSIAMANGPDEVQAKASFVAGSNREEGFAKAIEEIFLRP